MRASFMSGRRHGRAGFVLLEVIVSLVILGISIATLMRSFQLSLAAIRKNDVVTLACVLAEQKLQELEVNPEKASSGSGTFEEQGYPNYSWDIKIQEEEIKYHGLKLKNKVTFLPLKHVFVKISYDDKKIKAFSPLQIETYLMPIERFSYQAKFQNELFNEEGRR